MKLNPRFLILAQEPDGSVITVAARPTIEAARLKLKDMRAFCRKKRVPGRLFLARQTLEVVK